MTVPNKGRQAAHILIDAVSVALEDGGGDAASLALQRLAEVEAFTVSHDDDSVNVDLAHVLGASMLNQNWLVARLTEATGVTRDEVLLQLREYIDSL